MKAVAPRSRSSCCLPRAIAAGAASACPLCKDAKADTDYAGGTASLPRGFYYSILLMVAAPFAVVGGLVTAASYMARRRVLAASAAGERSAADRRLRRQPRGRMLPDSRGAQP